MWSMEVWFTQRTGEKSKGKRWGVERSFQLPRAQVFLSTEWRWSPAEVKVIPSTGHFPGRYGGRDHLCPSSVNLPFLRFQMPRPKRIHSSSFPRLSCPNWRRPFSYSTKPFSVYLYTELSSHTDWRTGKEAGLTPFLFPAYFHSLLPRTEPLLFWATANMYFRNFR